MTNKGHRKVIADRVVHDDPVPVEVYNRETRTWSPHPTQVRRAARLVGTCGHTLWWLWQTRYPGGDWPADTYYLTTKVGRRMACQHVDCEIHPKAPREERETDCTWLVGVDDSERRCRTTAKWDTDHGRLCTRHRDYLLRNGYLDGPGASL